MRLGDMDMHPVTEGLGWRWDRTEVWTCVGLLEDLGANSKGIKKQI